MQHENACYCKDCFRNPGSHGHVAHNAADSKESVQILSVSESKSGRRGFDTLAIGKMVAVLAIATRGALAQSRILMAILRPFHLQKRHPRMMLTTVQVKSSLEILTAFKNIVISNKTKP